MAKEIRVRYIPTDFNYADILTKPLVLATFKRIRDLCQDRKDANGLMLLSEEPNQVNHDSFLIFLPGMEYGI